MIVDLDYKALHAKGKDLRIVAWNPTDMWHFCMQLMDGDGEIVDYTYVTDEYKTSHDEKALLTRGGVYLSVNLRNAWGMVALKDWILAKLAEWKPDIIVWHGPRFGRTTLSMPAVAACRLQGALLDHMIRAQMPLKIYEFNSLAIWVTEKNGRAYLRCVDEAAALWPEQAEYFYHLFKLKDKYPAWRDAIWSMALAKFSLADIALRSGAVSLEDLTPRQRMAFTRITGLHPINILQHPAFVWKATPALGESVGKTRKRRRKKS
jgi:hypothetical protein